MLRDSGKRRGANPKTEERTLPGHVLDPPSGHSAGVSRTGVDAGPMFHNSVVGAPVPGNLFLSGRVLLTDMKAFLRGRSSFVCEGVDARERPIVHSAGIQIFMSQSNAIHLVINIRRPR